MLMFIHGVMGCGKSARIIEFCKNHKDAVCLKPKFDEEFNTVIHSRNGESVPCINFTDETDLVELFFRNRCFNTAKYILVDEVQFCTRKQIEQLNNISKIRSVTCYGLLRNVDNSLFPVIADLLYYADYVKEFTRKCVCCKEKTAFISGRYLLNEKNIYVNNNEAHFYMYGTAKPLPVNKDTKYLSLCKDCYETKTSFTPKEINTMLKGEM